MQLLIASLLIVSMKIPNFVDDLRTYVKDRINYWRHRRDR